MNRLAKRNPHFVIKQHKYASKIIQVKNKISKKQAKYDKRFGIDIKKITADIIGTDWSNTADYAWTRVDGAGVTSIQFSTILETLASYRVVYVVSDYIAGSLTISLGGTDDIVRTANGIYVFDDIQSTDLHFYLTGDATADYTVTINSIYKR